VLLIEEIKNAQTGVEEEADLRRRHAVRLQCVVESDDPVRDQPITQIEWLEDDALPFPIYLAADEGRLTDLSVARGNVVLADHGRTLQEGYSLPDAPEEGRYRPEIPHPDVTYQVPYDHEKAKKKAAERTLEGDPRAALPVVELTDPQEKKASSRKCVPEAQKGLTIVFFKSALRKKETKSSQPVICHHTQGSAGFCVQIQSDDRQSGCASYRE